VKEPAVLLLDEPLGALDLKLRREMQFELKEMQQILGITFIYVTHDQEEALTMANRIAVMDGGHVLQVGHPESIYESPVTRFVADFIGETNFLQGRLLSSDGTYGKVSLDDDVVVGALVNGDVLEPGQAVTVAVRPEKVVLHSFDPNDETVAGMNRLQGHIEETFYIGTDTRYIVRVSKNASLIVRVQNASYSPASVFKPRDVVTVYWEERNSRILME
jgi:spermidine/putrescine transport system ATP-binding protein